MKTDMQNTELYQSFKKALGINDLRADDNPYIAECCKIAEDYAKFDCFYLQSEKTPDNSGEYEVITNRGRVIKIKYKLFEDNGIWECEYSKHEINESVVAWRFLK